MLRDPAGSRAIVEACQARAVCLVNSFASKPLTVKSLLALFHEPEAEDLRVGLEPLSLESAEVETILLSPRTGVTGPLGPWGNRDDVFVLVNSGMPVGPESAFEVEFDRDPRRLGTNLRRLTLAVRS